MKKLLLIEDDPNTREGLAALLRLDGHWVQAASNGRAGLELAAATAFDAMLCDYKLPDMSGLEVCRRLRKLHRPLMLFLLTAYNNAEINHAAEDCGVGKIFYKPIDLDDLFATLVSLTTPLALGERPFPTD
jgi:OmpR-family two-component system manganese-sensing response regulator